MRLSRSGFAHAVRRPLTTPGTAFVALTTVAVAAWFAVQPSDAEMRGVAAADTACVPMALQTLGGPTSTVAAVSPKGLAVGLADDDLGVPQPVIWRNGTVTKIFTGLPGSLPTAVNDAGEVVGIAQAPAIEGVVGWYWKGGKAVLMAAPPGEGASPAAISNAGVIVGSLVDNQDTSDTHAADGPSQAAVWSSPRALPKELKSLPGASGSDAYSVSEDGIVGGVSIGDGQTAVLWDRGGRPTRRPDLGGGWGVVNDVTAAGTAVGAAAAPNGLGRATRWDDKGRPVDLGGVPAGATSVAKAVSRSGYVAGSVETPTGSTRHQAAVRWTPSGRSQALPPGVHRAGATATGITEAGAVFGYTSDGEGRRFATQWRCGA